jgi:DNA modification methylase
MFKIYNKSSVNMAEIDHSSIDLIITSPPFNLGTKYENFEDNLEINVYFDILKNVIKECFRVLKNDGLFVIEVSDTIFSNKLYIELAGLIQHYCIKEGFSLKKRDFNFANTKDYIQIPDHGWDKDYTTFSNAHSNLNQIMVFSKKNINFNINSQVTYSNYVPSNIHPCPFPKNHISLFLNSYFKKGFNVLDPFMGTAELGAEVIKRKGNFFGYEIVKKYYEEANKKLSSLA